MKILASIILLLVGIQQSCGSNALAQRPHSVSLQCTASITPPPLVGYYFYREKQGQSSFTRLNSTPQVNCIYTDTTVQKKTTYTYYATAVNSTGQESPHSNTFTVKVPNP